MKQKSDKSFVNIWEKSMVRRVKKPIPLFISKQKLASLYQSLTPSSEKSKRGVIQFLSAYKGEGAGGISFELANFVASNTKKRVLFLDASLVPPPSMRFVSSECKDSIASFLKKGTSKESPFVQLEGSGLFCGRLFDVSGENTYINPEDMVSLFQYLRDEYDIIFLYNEATLANESSAIFSRISDGSVIVVQAERTRSYVVKRLSSVIQENGGNVIGAILNKRRFYTPSWIHRLFFSAPK